MHDVHEVQAGRGSMPTMPERAGARTSDAGFDSDSGSIPLERPRLTWSVDLGAELRAMSTFDLWHYLAGGRLAPDTRVWRVGREAWTPAAAVPELACALRLSSSDLAAGAADGPRERVTVDYLTTPPTFGITEEVEDEEGERETHPRLRTSLPEMIFSPAELAEIEAAAAASAATTDAPPHAVSLPPRATERSPIPSRAAARRAVVRRFPALAAALVAVAAVALMAPAVASERAPAEALTLRALSASDLARTAAGPVLVGAHGVAPGAEISRFVRRTAEAKATAAPGKKGQRRGSRARTR